MPAGGGSGEGGLAARGYGGVAQPGGNYGGTNVVGTGGGFLGDRSALNAAVQNTQYYKNEMPVRSTLPKPVPKPVPIPKPMPVVKIVKDPKTGKIVQIDANTGQVIGNYTGSYNYYGMDDYATPGFFSPGKIQDRIPGDYSDYDGPVPGGSDQWGRDWGGIGGGMGSDPGSPTGWSGSGKDQSQVPGAKDPSRLSSSSMMMAPAGAEQPMVSPGPVGPGGQPMGNRPTPFQVGSPNLALIHDQWRRRAAMNEHPQAKRLGYGRMGEAQRILQGLRQGRRQA